MNGSVATKKLLSYSALGGVIYLVFRFMPGNQFDDDNGSTKLVTLTCAVVAVYAVIDYLCNPAAEKEEKSEKNEPSEQDKKVQELIEKFTEIAGGKNNKKSCGTCSNSKNASNKPTSTEGFADVTSPDNESFLDAEDDVVSREDLESQLTELKVKNEKLRQTIDVMKSNEELQKKMDPFNDPGHSYSTDPNRVTTNDPTIPNSIRKIGKGSSTSRQEDGVIKNEMVYTDHNSLPVADGYKSDADQYGWSYLPPEKWFPQPANPPVCVTEKRSAVTPIWTTGVPMDLKEWNSSRRVTPPMGINTEYVDDKLNSGR